MRRVVQRMKDALAPWRKPWLIAAACIVGLALVTLLQLSVAAPLREQVSLRGMLRGESERSVHAVVDFGEGAGRAAYRVTENGQPLTRATSAAAVRRGEGGWAYADGAIWFNASDGADPRTNGRVYTLDRPVPVPSGVFWLLALALVGALLQAAPGETMRARVSAVTGFRDWPSVVIFAAIGVMLWFKAHEWLFLNGGGEANWLRWLALIALAGGGSWLLRAAPRGPRAIIATVSAMFAFALIAGAPPAVLEHSFGLLQHHLVRLFAGIILASLTGYAVYRWAGLGAVPIVLYNWAYHDLKARYVLAPNVEIDWAPVSETTLFFIIALTIAAAIWRAAPAERRAKGFEQSAFAIMLIFTAAHFGNYYYSGMEKVGLNGGPFSWLVENPTYFLGYNGAALGAPPIAGSPGLVAGLGGMWHATNFLGNLVTLASQLASVIAPLAPMFIAPLTIIYDLWHLGVYALTGIFFWKWMALNAALVFAWRKPPPIGFRLRLLAVLMVMLSGNFFLTARLGWYDTAQLNRVEVLALTRSGERVPVPPAYFRGHSFAFISFMNWGPDMMRDFSPTNTWGTTTDVDIMRRASRCEALPAAVAPDAQLVNPGLADFIRDTDRRRRAEGIHRASEGAYLYPHHVTTDRFAYAAFDRLELTDIKAYVIRVQALCTLRGAGAPRVMREVELEPIPVP